MDLLDHLREHHRRATRRLPDGSGCLPDARWDQPFHMLGQQPRGLQLGLRCPVTGEVRVIGDLSATDEPELPPRVWGALARAETR